MKKLIFVVLFVSLAIVLSVSVLAQSGEEDVSVSDTTANEQLQGEAVAFCPYAPDGWAGCCILGYDGSTTGSNNPPGCCRYYQPQSAPTVTPDAGDSASAPAQIRRGCCWR